MIRPSVCSPTPPYFYHQSKLAKAELGQYWDAIADLKSALGLTREIGSSDFITFIERKIAEFEKE